MEIKRTNIMNLNNTSQIKATVIGVIIGSVLTLGAYTMFASDHWVTTQSADRTQKQPLYWVAPMDPDFRKDKPGKSPMGMDLIPYYGDDGSGPDEGPGTIRISPDVVNNLGVRTAVAQYKALHMEIDTVGYVTFNEDKLVHIHPRIQGWIEKLYVKAIGDPVKNGQPLYDIYSPELVNAQEEFLLALERKNKRLIVASQNRLIALQIPEPVISRLKKTRKVQQNITFFAPQKGIVENLKIREGFFVKPGSTIMSIGDLSEVWVEAEVFERQVSQVKTGTPVTMTLDYLPGTQWQGKVDYIYPILDAKTRTVKVRLRFLNEHGQFKPNMFAQITIHTTGDENALLIPKEALIRTGKQDRVVLALGQGSYKSVEVTVGRFDNNSVEILAGLSEGEAVVSSAQFLLDSESSKSSDFKRMHNKEEVTESQSNDAVASKVWVQAQVQSLMAEHKMLTLVHDAIPQWGWPEMTMDFIAAESVDFSLLSAGLKLKVELTKNSKGDYQVSDILLTGSGADSNQHTNRATVNGIINAILPGYRMLNISRGPIEKWDRPAATMDFIVSEQVDISSLTEETEITFTFEIRDGDFIIIYISDGISDDISEDILNESTSETMTETRVNKNTVVDHSKH